MGAMDAETPSCWQKSSAEIRREREGNTSNPLFPPALESPASTSYWAMGQTQVGARQQEGSGEPSAGTGQSRTENGRGGQTVIAQALTICQALGWVL